MTAIKMSFFYTNEVISGPQIRMGTQENQSFDYRVGIFSPTTNFWPLWRGEGLEGESTICVNDLINSAHMMKTP